MTVLIGTLVTTGSYAEGEDGLHSDFAGILTLDSGDQLTLNAGEVLSSDLIVPPGATIAGDGTISGLATVAGTVEVGTNSSAGARLTFNGGLRMDPQARMLIDVVGPGVAGMGYDQIAGNGAEFILDGLLRVTVSPNLNGTGQSFAVVTNPVGLSGTFTNVVGQRLQPFNLDGFLASDWFDYAEDGIAIRLFNFGALDRGTIFRFK